MAYPVKSNGHTIYLHMEGSGKPLLVINGLTRPLSSWSKFTRAMNYGRTVISFDAPGVGQSPTPMFPLSISALASMVADILDKCGLEKCDIIGFSHGGAVAQQFAYQYPHRVDRLILASTLCGIGHAPGNPVALYSMREPKTSVLGALWRLLAISSWSSVPFLTKIKAPTLVICGINDNIAPVSNSRYLANRIPNATLVIINAKHDLQDSDYEQFAAQVDAFLT